MQLASTAETLAFLQTEYERFRAFDAAQQAQALEFNELVRLPCEKPEVPLRTLYIDLLMHDEMLRHSQATHDTKRDRIEILIRNKVALQMMIRQRERVEEAVTPDPRTELKAATLDDVLAWLPQPHREDFRQHLEPVWQSHNPQTLLSTLVQKCVVLGCRSVEDFRALFTIIEWVLYTHKDS